MNNSGTLAPGHGISVEAQRELIARIIASRPFARAPQLKEFLLFILERASVDGGASINETEIGRNVLRRQQPDFDPSTDNIVRVQARHLRHKLDEYFSGEGRDEPVVLTIPKGTYVPKLASRETAGTSREAEAGPNGASAGIAQPAAQTSGASADPVPATRTLGSSRWRAWSSMGALACVLMLGVVAGSSGGQNRSGVR